MYQIDIFPMVLIALLCLKTRLSLDAFNKTGFEVLAY